MKTTLFSIIAATLLIIASINVNGNNGKTAEEPGKNAIATGKVTDKQTGESLAGALIQIKGTDISVYTDLDGNFTITNIEPGEYNIEITYISYNGAEVENVVLSAGVATRVNIGILPN